MPTKSFSLLRTLTWLNLFLIMLQVVYFTITLLTTGMIHILIAQSVSFDFMTSAVVVLPLLGFIVSQAFIYTLFVGLIWYLAMAIGELLLLSATTTYNLGVGLWLMSVMVILVENSIHYQQSLFAFHHLNNIQKYFMLFGYWVGLVCVAVAAALTLLNLCILLYKKTIRKKDVIAVVLMIGVGTQLLSVSSMWAPRTMQTVATAQRPNIILISVEALRPEYIQKSYGNSTTMPFLASLLADSVQFTDAYTPIAQSFPSWVSILTSKTPMHHGSRSFYTNYNNIDFHDLLLQKLKANGYETMYAVDGQRFGDITEAFGFDRIISPPNGAAELVIGTMSDFPLSNLIISTRLGHYLFPYSYANRTVVATYQPADFNRLLMTEISQRSKKPLFLAVHFGVSHWPYRWADDQQRDDTILPLQYQHSLRAADEQIKEFYNYLSQEKLLDHAIIVFMSDHGVGLGVRGDSLANKNNYVGAASLFPSFKKLPYSTDASSRGIDTSYGYSTDILSLMQFHVLLAFKANGLQLGTPHQVSDRVSLLDIGPTILGLLNIPNMQHIDGVSLVDQIKKNLPLRHQDRELFFENGFTTPEVAQADISVSSVLQASIRAVVLDSKTGLLSLTAPAEKLLLNDKQRALLFGDWLLARFPQSVDATCSPACSVDSYMVLVNLKNRKWTADMHSSFARQAPLQKLLRDFKQYNGRELPRSE